MPSGNMDSRTAKELGEMIAGQMGNPEGVYLKVAPNPAAGTSVCRRPVNRVA
jgi:hypothetical protein